MGASTAVAVRVYIYAPPRERTSTWSADGGEVLIKLGDESTAPSLWRNHRMREPDAREALRIVEENQELFLEEWRRLHGA